MNKTTKNILVVAGAYVGYKLWEFYTAFRKLQYGINGIQFKAVTDKSMLLNVGLYIKNTTSLEFLVGNLDADVYFNNCRVGRINYPINRYLAGKAVNTFNVGVELFYSESMQAVWDMLLNLSNNLSTDNWICRVAGNIELSNRRVPLNIVFTSDSIKK